MECLGCPEKLVEARFWLMPVDFAMKVADLACEELGMMGSEFRG
jgi:hypothetical protein